jgi:hypothetical protein
MALRLITALALVAASCARLAVPAVKASEASKEKKKAGAEPFFKPLVSAQPALKLRKRISALGTNLTLGCNYSESSHHARRATSFTAACGSLTARSFVSQISSAVW